MSVLAITAAASALLFALGSWLIVEHWVYPRVNVALRAFGDQGLPTAAQRDAHPVLRLCMPYLCIALAQLAGSLALISLPKLAGASLLHRTLFLGSAIFAGWLTAVVAFVPPGLTSVLVFTPPVLILLLLSWLAASPIALLLRRRRRHRA